MLPEIVCEKNESPPTEKDNAGQLVDTEFMLKEMVYNLQDNSRKRNNGVLEFFRDLLADLLVHAKVWNATTTILAGAADW